MKSLSVIVPVYNGEKWLERCVNSLLKQDYENMEMILIDDGSIDSSLEIAEQLKTSADIQGKRIRVIHQENHGVAYTRNYGIKIATGEYIAFIDQDDYVKENYCSCLMQPTNEESYDIVLDGYIRKKSNGKEYGKVTMSKQEWSKFLVVAPWARVFRRQFLMEHKLHFLAVPMGEDIFLNLNAYARTNRIAYISNCGYYYCDNKVSVSQSKQRKAGNRVSPLPMLNAVMKSRPVHSYISKELEEYYFIRYVIWYLLFSFRKSERKGWKRMAGKLLGWLRKNFPDYKRNPYLRIKQPMGESRKVHAVVVAGIRMLGKLYK